jgi:hypothetical protein
LFGRFRYVKNLSDLFFVSGFMQFGVGLGGFLAVMFGMHMMGMGKMRLVRRSFVIAIFVVPDGVAVMLGGLFMVVGGVGVMIGGALGVRHNPSPCCAPGVA